MHWTDIMPELNLGTEGAVPYRSGSRRMATLPVNQANTQALKGGGKVAQPDLGHPQGFGWALRELCLRKPYKHAADIEQLLDNHAGWNGRHAVTDANRLTLARMWADEVGS